MKKEKLILHVNNWCNTGGVPSFIYSMSRAFPEFQHVMCSIQEAEEYELVDYSRIWGIRYMQAPIITRELIESIRPSIVILHNITRDKVQGYGWDVFYDVRTIFIHHNLIKDKPKMHINLEWYVSDWVKGDNKDGVVIPPCIYSPPYIDIVRPFRDKMVIGRIQSRTRGDVTDETIEMLDNISGTDSFIVSPTKGNRVRPGRMPEFLNKIDVLAMFTNGTESWSMVTTEANLSGIPVVALRRNDGLTEQLNQSGGGLLVNTKQGFIEALEQLRDDELQRKTLSSAGREWCLENATEKRLRKELVDYFLDWL